MMDRYADATGTPLSYWMPLQVLDLADSVCHMRIICVIMISTLCEELQYLWCDNSTVHLTFCSYKPDACTSLMLLQAYKPVGRTRDRAARFSIYGKRQRLKQICMVVGNTVAGALTKNCCRITWRTVTKKGRFCILNECYILECFCEHVYFLANIGFLYCRLHLERFVQLYN